MCGAFWYFWHGGCFGNFWFYLKIASNHFNCCFKAHARLGIFNIHPAGALAQFFELLFGLMTTTTRRIKTRCNCTYFVALLATQLMQFRQTIFSSQAMCFHNFSQTTNCNEGRFNLLTACASLYTSSGVSFETTLRLFRTLAQELLTLLQTGHTNVKIFTTQRHVCCLAINNCTCFALGTGSCNFCGLRFLKRRQNAFQFTHTTLILRQTSTNLLRRIIIDL